MFVDGWPPGYRDHITLVGEATQHRVSTGRRYQAVSKSHLWHTRGQAECHPLKFVLRSFPAKDVLSVEIPT